MSIPLAVVAGLAATTLLFWLLCVPKRLGVGAAAGPERPGPPERPLGIPLAAAVMDRLVRAGMTPAAIHQWWGRPRPELADATPRQAALSGAGRWVLELAERDAACVEAEWEVPA